MEQKQYYNFLIKQICEYEPFKDCFDEMVKAIPEEGKQKFENLERCHVRDSEKKDRFMFSLEKEMVYVYLKKGADIYNLQLYPCRYDGIPKMDKLDSKRCGDLCAQFEYENIEDKIRLLILFDLVNVNEEIYLAVTKIVKRLEDKVDCDNAYASMFIKIDQDKVEEFLTDDAITV